MAEQRRRLTVQMSVAEINAMGVQVTAWMVLVWLLWPLDWWRTAGVVAFVVVNGACAAVARRERGVRRG